MHLLALDAGPLEAEFRQKFGPDHQYTFWNDGYDNITGSTDESEDHTEEENETDEAFDFDAYEQQQRAFAELLAAADVIFTWGATELPAVPPGTPVFAEASTKALVGTYFGAGGDRATPTYGFCGLPTLLSRSLLEVSVVMGGDETKLRETCGKLGTDYRVVADRVGLATPRVLAMLVNEACFTLQEGTAAAADIDRAMQLGTNYPRGPLAWGDAIGPARVLAVLDAMWHDTHDARYRACPLLRTRATLGEGLAAD